ncbi:hypothetical protein N9B22_02090 [bacterium]|nr:hypothetical protein [bacterium]MDA7885116.1 hypothetical protein [bacterium]MDA7906530.1 hypothetical protein [Mariniblastus sp.]MDB4379854.1 hypothetical protein [Mariniblastus sp.]MDC0294793.1 hypothetical protein [Mariniblastus sp.]
MSKPAPTQRKQNYIDAQVQGALLKRICLHWAVFFVVAAFSVIVLQTLLGDPGLSIFQRLKLETGEFAIIGIVMISMFPAFMLDTIRFSNRFVGPIVRLKSHLRQLSEGKVQHCQFRNDDFWTDMADEFNGAAAFVEAQQKEIAQLRAKLAAQNSGNFIGDNQ